MEIRKAKLSDLDEMARLVTLYLGTCNIPEKNNGKTIFELNKEEILQDLKCYYVCEEDNKILGLCGISEPRVIEYKLAKTIRFPDYREILYLVVDEKFRGQGIGTRLLQECCNFNDYTIIYEAWGDGEKVNSYQVLKNCGFMFCISLGDTYYKDHGYCPYCVNYDTGCCISCKAEIWLKV